VPELRTTNGKRVPVLIVTVAPKLTLKLEYQYSPVAIVQVPEAQVYAPSEPSPVNCNPGGTLLMAVPLPPLPLLADVIRPSAPTEMLALV
jgi:hypothetical protein